MSERQQLVIQGKGYELAWVDHLDGGLGEKDHDMLRITLERGRPAERTIATVLHEALHLISDEFVLALDEDTINRLESGLYCFLSESGVDLLPLIREPGS
ncbi:MAG: hypothetical protein PHS14_15515 [Elusimicrobia bacterium]|nr:hypothetical protein [Elusimicrobiota bacterium]